MITTPLLPHQREGVEAFLNHPSAYAFLWTVGTGKSLAALSCADAINAKRILITSDKNNTINTWPDQVTEHTDWLEPLVRPKNPETFPVWISDSNVVACVNYDYLPSCPWLKDIPFDMWIGDEAGDFKDNRTDRFKHLQCIVRDIPNKLILNAEPMTERLEDLFGQFKVLDNGEALGNGITQFRLRFMQPSPTGYGWVAQRSAFTRVRHAVRHMSNWIVNRPDLKLPRKVFTTVRVPMSEQQEYLDRDLKEWMQAELEGAKIETNYAPVVFTKRLQLMGGIFHGKEETDQRVVHTHKLPALVDILERNKTKAVVWHHYIAETKLLAECLTSNGIPFVKYEGPQDGKQLAKFKRMKSGVMLIRDSMCKGLNQLADGDMCIFYSHPYSYRQRMQAMGRTCRLTSKHECLNVIDLVTEGGVDEIVHHMLTQKKNFSLALSSIRDYVSRGNKPERNAV